MAGTGPALRAGPVPAPAPRFAVSHSCGKMRRRQGETRSPRFLFYLDHSVRLQFRLRKPRQQVVHLRVERIYRACVAMWLDLAAFVNLTDLVKDVGHLTAKLLAVWMRQRAHAGEFEPPTKIRSLVYGLDLLNGPGKPVQVSVGLPRNVRECRRPLQRRVVSECAKSRVFFG